MTQYTHEPLTIGERMDLASSVTDRGYSIHVVQSEDGTRCLGYTNGEFNAYKIAHDLNTLALVIAEAKKPYSTGESIRAILGVEADPIKFHYVSESFYVSTDDDDNYERGEN